MTIARRPIASIAQVDGLQGALDAKLALAGGTLTGQVYRNQLNGTTAPAIKVDQRHATLLYDQAAIWLRNHSAGIGMYVKNESTGWAISVVNGGSGRGMSFENNAGGIGMYFQNKANGTGLNLVNTAASTARGAWFQTLSTSSGASALYASDATDKSSPATCIEVDHSGTGYGIDIQNFAAAASAFVIHQYSQASGFQAIRVDNCGTQPAVEIWNTENTTLAPGQFGSGRFINLRRRPATGEAVEDCFYISGEGVMCAVPKAAVPATLADGMLWFEGAGAAMVLKARINGATHTVTTVAD